MKKSMTLALAASMFVLVMVETPHRAIAATPDCYLHVDGPGNTCVPVQPTQHGIVVTIILTILGL